MREVVDLVSAQPALDHSARSLAARVGVSSRYLARLFASELDTTPARYVEQVRLDHAKALRDEGHGVAQTAHEAGLAARRRCAGCSWREAATVAPGVKTDVLGIGLDELTEQQRAEVVAAHPRPDFKNRILKAFCDGMAHRPNNHLRVDERRRPRPLRLRIPADGLR